MVSFTYTNVYQIRTIGPKNINIAIVVHAKNITLSLPWTINYSLKNTHPQSRNTQSVRRNSW